MIFPSNCAVYIWTINYWISHWNQKFKGACLIDVINVSSDFYVPISYRGEFPDSCPLRHDGIAVAIKTLSFTAPPCPSCLYTWHQQCPSNPTIISFSFHIRGRAQYWQCLCWHFPMWLLPVTILCCKLCHIWHLCCTRIEMNLVHKFPFQKLLQSERKVHFSSPLYGGLPAPLGVLSASIASD